MITTGELVSAIQGKFEGGTSFAVDWYRVLKEGAQATLQNIAPQNLMREQPIYGGAIDGLTVYYCPTEVAAPKGLYTNLARLKYNYVPTNIFEMLVAQGTDQLIFTIATKNGARFIMVNTGAQSSLFTINEMDSTAGLTADMPISVNTFDYLSGSGGIQGTFTDTLKSVAGTFDTPQDASNFSFGTALIPIRLIDPRKIASIKLFLKTTDVDYLELDASTALDYLIQGWNTVRVNMVEAVPNGTPDLTNLTAWEVQVTMNTGETQTIIIDRIAIAQSALYNLGYASNLLFLDVNTYERVNQPTHDTDMIDLTDEEVEILKYECCRIVVQEATVDQQNANESKRFDTELSRKYQLYLVKNPSAEMPVSYNNTPDIDRTVNLGNVFPR